MNYLENMGENLELLDLVKKCNVTTYSLRSIRDKNTAIKNLKGAPSGASQSFSVLYERESM